MSALLVHIRTSRDGMAAQMKRVLRAVLLHEPLHVLGNASGSQR